MISCFSVGFCMSWVGVGWVGVGWVGIGWVGGKLCSQARMGILFCSSVSKEMLRFLR